MTEDNAEGAQAVVDIAENKNKILEVDGKIDYAVNSINSNLDHMRQTQEEFTRQTVLQATYNSLRG
jgi:hypothetical protein